MMSEGKIIADIPAEKKKEMKVEDLMTLFEKSGTESYANDRMLLG